MPNTPLLVDTPIGRIALPKGQAAAAREMTDEELSERINNRPFIDPAEFAVAQERGFCSAYDGKRHWFLPLEQAREKAEAGRRVQHTSFLNALLGN